MSYSSRKAYADIGDSAPQNREYLVDNPRRKVTVTKYRIHTRGESTTSYPDRREYTAYGSRGSSSCYQVFPDAGYTARRPRNDFRMPEASYKPLGAEYTYLISTERVFGRPVRRETTITASQITITQAAMMMACWGSATQKDPNSQLKSGEDTAFMHMPNIHSKRTSSQHIEVATLNTKKPQQQQTREK